MARLVLLGGGHSHIEVLRRAPAMRLSGELVLVEPNDALPYTGMVPGFIAGLYLQDEILIDLQRLCAHAGAVFKRGHAVAVDTGERYVRCDDGTILRYDVLSMDVGSTLDMSVPGAAEHTLPVRPLRGFIEQWPGAAERGSRIAVVGAGAAGIELALSLESRLQSQGGRLSVTVVGEAPIIASGIADGARRRLERHCAARGIPLHLGHRVAQVTSASVILETGLTIPADTVLWATGPVPHRWLRAGGLVLDEGGYLAVDRHLRVGGRPDLYAAGDTASIMGHPRPKAGVYAVREAPVLAENLRRALIGEPPTSYVPQPRALALIGTGDGNAVAAYGPFSGEGAWVWRWKDRIDRRFVQRYRC